MRPARRLGHELTSTANSDIAKNKAAADLRDRLTQLEHGKPEPPRVPRLILGDETPENLAWTLAKQWPSGGVVSSEAGVVFGAHGMGKDSVMRNLALLNILWDGGSLSIGRRTSESFTVKGARLTVALQIQEAALRAFFDKSGGLARGTGLPAYPMKKIVTFGRGAAECARTLLRHWARGLRGRPGVGQASA